MQEGTHHTGEGDSEAPKDKLIMKRQRTVRLAPHGPLSVQLTSSLSNPPVAEQIRLALGRFRGKVLDVLRTWDEDGSGQISRETFHDAMRALGLEGSTAGRSGACMHTCTYAYAVTHLDPACVRHRLTFFFVRAMRGVPAPSSLLADAILVAAVDEIFTAWCSEGEKTLSLTGLCTHQAYMPKLALLFGLH